jgi:hypothetical protein
VKENDDSSSVLFVLELRKILLFVFEVVLEIVDVLLAAIL